MGRAALGTRTRSNLPNAKAGAAFKSLGLSADPSMFASLVSSSEGGDWALGRDSSKAVAGETPAAALGVCARTRVGKVQCIEFTARPGCSLRSI